MWGPEFKPFWDHWAINPWLGGIKNGPFGTKNGLTWQACQCPDVVQKGPKWSQMVNITCFWPFGTIWTHLHHFGPFKTKINFSPQKHKVLLGQSSLEQKIKFCLKWSKRVQMGLKWPQMVKKFGYSQTPRTANTHKSFLVLRCIWKEPAPFYNIRDSGIHSQYLVLYQQRFNIYIERFLNDTSPLLGQRLWLN